VQAAPLSPVISDNLIGVCLRLVVQAAESTCAYPHEVAVLGYDRKSRGMRRVLWLRATAVETIVPLQVLCTRCLPGVCDNQGRWSRACLPCKVPLRHNLSEFAHGLRMLGSATCSALASFFSFQQLSGRCIASDLSTCTALARSISFQRLPDRCIVSNSSAMRWQVQFLSSGLLADALQAI
jgi:hypothetical protein